jgi:hypothetical protein
MRRICPYALPNHPSPRNNATTALVRSDSLAERGEFELPVPVENSVGRPLEPVPRYELRFRRVFLGWDCRFFNGIRFCFVRRRRPEKLYTRRNDLRSLSLAAVVLYLELARPKTALESRPEQSRARRA